MSKASKKSKDEASLGRLSALGPKEAWQTALLLPHSWDDLRHEVTNFSKVPDEDWLVCRGRLHGDLSVRFDSPPRLVGYLTDGITRIGFSAFGDTRKLQEMINDTREDVILFGERSWFDNRLWLRNVQVVSERWIGRLRPRYPGKPRVISTDTARQRVLSHLKEAVPVAADWLVSTLESDEQTLLRQSKTEEKSIQDILKRAHLPFTIEQGVRAQQALERLAAYGAIRTIESYRRGTRAIDQNHLARANWESIAARLPHPLVPEQRAAVEDILDRIFTGIPIRHFLAGDVGTGKTAVYATVATTIFASGGRIAVMLPNQALAEQVAREVSTWWPNLPVKFVTGDGNSNEDLAGQRFIVGTQALLFRDIGKMDLLIVDEQQKFSREQREKMLHSESHLLEVSATCIPRSQALVQYGVLSMSKLHKGHVEKDIRTKVWRSHERRALMDGVRSTLAEGKKVIVVYPKRESSEADTSTLPSAEEAYELWSSLFPGRVRLAHGGLNDAANTQAIADLREGVADILISTSMIEVGLNVAKLARIVIVHAERFGLSALHQMRGRVAREGGIGYCDLFLPAEVSEAVNERLWVLEETTDGFEVAAHDMRIRGFGDLSADSDKQTGSDDTFLFGRALQPELLDEILAAA